MGGLACNLHLLLHKLPSLLAGCSKLADTDCTAMDREQRSSGSSSIVDLKFHCCNRAPTAFVAHILGSADHSRQCSY